MRWFFGLLLSAGTALADPLPDLFSVLAEMEGREVQVTGLVGNWDSYGPHIKTDNGNFGLTYALPREKLKKTESCQLDIFSDEEACRAIVTAELRVSSDQIELLVFDIDFLGE